MDQVEALALQKWGGQEALDQEKQRRLMKKLERAKTKAGAALLHRMSMTSFHADIIRC